MISRSGLAPAGSAGSSGAELRRLARVLATQGRDPQVHADVVVLPTCPFDSLAPKHTAVVCGLDQSFAHGVADGLGCADVAAGLEPDPPHCCAKPRREMS